VHGWREFLDRYQKEDPILGYPLKNAIYEEFPDRVEVTMNKVLAKTIGDKKSVISERFAALTGGKKLVFLTADKKEEGRSVAEEEKREEEAQDAKTREEVRNDPTVKSLEQLGFELKKIGKL